MDQAFLEKLNETIRANMSQPAFGADDLAQLMGMSHSSLLRKVQALTGKSINQLIREARLNEAWQMIHQEGVTASEVAFRVGFSTPAYFNTSFHRFFGYPPGDARKMAGHSSPALARKPGSAKRLVILLLILFVIITAAHVAFNIHLESEVNRSIAVLPLGNLTNDSLTLAFSEGLREQLLNDLENLKIFSVRSRISTDQYRTPVKKMHQIGKELHADFILEGRVAKNGDQIRIWIQLIETKSDIHLWSDYYTRTIGNLFDIQTEVAGDIIKKLDAVLVAGKPLLTR